MRTIGGMFKEVVRLAKFNLIHLEQKLDTIKHRVLDYIRLQVNTLHEERDEFGMELIKQVKQVSIRRVKRKLESELDGFYKCLEKELEEFSQKLKEEVKESG